MFLKDIINLVTKLKIHSYITPRLDFLINFYAIAIYADEVIQMEELTEAKILLRKVITNEYNDLDKEKINEIIEYYFLNLKQELHKYKSEPGYFELQKLKLENEIQYITKENLKEVLMIFKADQDFNYKEREFYEKYKNIL